MTNSNSPQALADAQRARTAAAERLAATAKSLATATRMHTDAQARVTQIERDDLDTEAALADQLVEQIARGEPTATLPSAPAPDAAHTAALQTARAYAAVTANALQTLKDAHANAIEEHKATEASVKFEVSAALASEAEVLAAQIVESDKKTVALREKLVAYVESLVDNQPGPLYSPRQRPRAIEDALRAPGGMFDPPTHIEGLQANGPHRARIEAASIKWLERSEQLKSGESAPAALKRA